MLFFYSSDEKNLSKAFYVENSFDYFLEEGNQYTLKKYVSIVSTINHSEGEVISKSIDNVRQAYMNGFDYLLKNHTSVWEEIWSKADIVIEGIYITAPAPPPPPPPPPLGPPPPPPPIIKTSTVPLNCGVKV